MPEATTREVTGEPRTLPLLLKAALPVLPGISRLPGVRKTGSALPQVTLTWHDVPVDRAHVAAYAEVCGFGPGETLPVTYPHLLAFPLHMAIMTDAQFPFPAIGTSTGEHDHPAPGDLGGRAAPGLARPGWPRAREGHALRPRHRGALRRRAGWEETSTFLRRGRPAEGAADEGLDLETVLVEPGRSGVSAPTWAAGTPRSPGTTTRSTCTA